MTITTLYNWRNVVFPPLVSMAALCVGGMILARTLSNPDLANEIRNAAKVTADDISLA